MRGGSQVKKIQTRRLKITGQTLRTLTDLEGVIGGAVPNTDGTNFCKTIDRRQDCFLGRTV